MKMSVNDIPILMILSQESIKSERKCISKRQNDFVFSSFLFCFQEMLADKFAKGVSMLRVFNF